MITVSTFVHGWYVDYIPIYIYCILRAYPEYYVKVFVNSDLPVGIKEQLDLLPSRRFVVEKIFAERTNADPTKKPYYLRWLLPHACFKDSEMVFLCDVDLIMLRESPPMHVQRLQVCEQVKRPFANFVRRPHPDYPDRFTGWHFLVTDPYYSKVEPVIQKILHDKTFDISNPPSYCYDNGTGEKQWGQEALLYQILDLAFGASQEMSEERIGFPNHHGLHLGPFRGMLPSLIAQGDAGGIAHMGENLKYWRMTQEMSEILSDPFYQYLESRVCEERVKSVLHKVRSYFHRNSLGAIPYL